MTANILVISNYNDYQSTRPEAEIFVSLAKKGWPIHIMTNKSENTSRFENAGIKVVDFHPTKKLDKKEVQIIRDYIIAKNISILHLFNSKAIINGIRAARGLKVKVVLYRGYTGNIHWYDPTAYFKYLNPRVDKIQCNSKGVEELLHRQLFFKNSKAVTINKGHDLDWYKNYKPYDIRKELGIPEKSLLLINVANNRRMKGIPYLLKSFKYLENNSSIHLLLIGRDMDNKENMKIINKHKLKSNIHILGYRKDVLNIVAACDAFILPSITGESITKSVLEAMSLGIAPIISDIPGNTELVINNENGMIFPAKNPKALSLVLKYLGKNKHLCKQFGKKSKNRIANVLNHRNTVSEVEKLYNELVLD